MQWLAEDISTEAFVPKQASPMLEELLLVLLHLAYGFTPVVSEFIVVMCCWLLLFHEVQEKLDTSVRTHLWSPLL